MLARSLHSRSIAAEEVLKSAIAALQHAHIETASLDARILLQHVLGVSRERLLAGDVYVSVEKQAQYQELVTERARRKPVAQLIGKREFYGYEFAVTGDTLDPRPDSETLIDAVLSQIKDHNASLRILDLGTGTGCLLITLLKELPNAQGVAVDQCERALEVAKSNARVLSVDIRTQFIKSLWAKDIQGTFDVVISNPPYIPTDVIPTLAPEVCRFEPVAALDGGKDGLECYRAICGQLPPLLSPEGFAVFEVGIGQHKALEVIAGQNGMHVIGMRDDMAGITRCVIMKSHIKDK